MSKRKKKSAFSEKREGSFYVVRGKRDRRGGEELAGGGIPENGLCPLRKGGMAIRPVSWGKSV